MSRPVTFRFEAAPRAEDMFSDDETAAIRALLTRDPVPAEESTLLNFVDYEGDVRGIVHAVPRVAAMILVGATRIPYHTWTTQEMVYEIARELRRSRI